MHLLCQCILTKCRGTTSQPNPWHCIALDSDLWVTLFGGLKYLAHFWHLPVHVTCPLNQTSASIVGPGVFQTTNGLVLICFVFRSFVIKVQIFVSAKIKLTARLPSFYLEHLNFWPYFTDTLIWQYWLKSVNAKHLYFKKNCFHSVVQSDLKIWFLVQAREAPFSSQHTWVLCA